MAGKAANSKRKRAKCEADPAGLPRASSLRTPVMKSASIVMLLPFLVVSPVRGESVMSLMLTSPAFFHEGEIPVRHTCQGDDSAPPLHWSGLPAGTQSLVLIVDDPDAPDPRAPKMTWVHWVLYNLPADAAGLPAGGALPVGTLEGINSWKRTGYGGPCPPIGRHRYFHKLYALDTVLPDLGKPDEAALEKAMRGHVLGQSQLVGTYQKL